MTGEAMARAAVCGHRGHECMARTLGCRATGREGTTGRLLRETGRLTWYGSQTGMGRLIHLRHGGQQCLRVPVTRVPEDVRSWAEFDDMSAIEHQYLVRSAG